MLRNENDTPFSSRTRSHACLAWSSHNGERANPPTARSPSFTERRSENTERACGAETSQGRAPSRVPACSSRQRPRRSEGPARGSRLAFGCRGRGRQRTIESQAKANQSARRSGSGAGGDPPLTPTNRSMPVCGRRRRAAVARGPRAASPTPARRAPRRSASPATTRSRRNAIDMRVGVDARAQICNRRAQVALAPRARGTTDPGSRDQREARLSRTRQSTTKREK
jgi:hypothetical protein